MEKVIIKSINELYDELQKSKGPWKKKRVKQSWNKEVYEKAPKGETSSIKKIRSSDVY